MIHLGPHLQEDPIAIVTITTRTTDGDAMTGTALTTATVGEREQDATTKETGTDPPDRGDLSVMAIMGGEMAPTLPANSLKPSQQSRKVVAALVGATITMA